MKRKRAVNLPYPLCAIDLDDTLLGPDHQISARNTRAVHMAVDLGVTIILASGRMYQATARYGRQLGLTSPILCYNGAMVRDPQTNELWLHEQVPADIADTVMDYCHERALQLNFYLDDMLYTAAYTPWMKLYHDRTGSPIEVREDFYTAFQGKSPTKMILIDSPETTDRLLPYWRERLGNSLYVTKSNDEYLEFLPPNANKGRAFELIARRYGMESKDTVAIGDSWNDLPMLRWAGLGIAVANAKPDLLKAAGRVTLSNAKDGVAEALDELYSFDSRE
jgi:Cof subfamily protein (haloacid dehalogenase superfamily)